MKTKFSVTVTNETNALTKKKNNILKDYAIKSVALNMSANLENSAVTVGLEKVSFHSNSKGGKCQRMFKLRHNCAHFTCKVMLKILQARFQ